MYEFNSFYKKLDIVKFEEYYLPIYQLFNNNWFTV